MGFASKGRAREPENPRFVTARVRVAQRLPVARGCPRGCRAAGLIWRKVCNHLALTTQVSSGTAGSGGVGGRCPQGPLLTGLAGWLERDERRLHPCSQDVLPGLSVYRNSGLRNTSELCLNYPVFLFPRPLANRPSEVQTFLGSIPLAGEFSQSSGKSEQDVLSRLMLLRIKTKRLFIVGVCPRQLEAAWVLDTNFSPPFSSC